MSKYEKYKPSMIDWIGNVPMHWNIKRLKDVANVTLGKMLQNDDSGSDDLKPYLRSFNVQWDRVDLSEVKEMWLSEYEQEQYRLNKFDLVVSEGGEVGRCAIWLDELEECYIQNSVHKVTCNKRILPYFLLYQFTTAGKAGFFEKIINKVSIGHLTREKLVSLSFVLPPTDEQLTIANYLDHQTQKIDRLIANKKAQAEKLKELRQIEINNSVIKGLNPNAELKDTGIDWQGKIPKHWDEKRLKNLVSPKITDGPHETPELVDDLDGIPFISAEAITENGINYDARGGNISVDQDRIYSQKCKPKRDDIFMVKSGSTTGRIGYVDTDLNFNIWSPLALIRSNLNMCSRYLYYALCSNYVQKQVQLTWSFGTQPNIGMGVIERLRVVIAPKNEQLEIANYLQVRTTAIDKLIININTQIEKLQELRKIKIYEAVTGKIKVNAYEEENI